jgi:hypothetical protein
MGNLGFAGSRDFLAAATEKGTAEEVAAADAALRALPRGADHLEPARAARIHLPPDGG